ncbi:hypothetical protein YC2023_084081 [Brassica napus]
MKLWLRAPLVNSDGDSKDAFPNNLVYVLNGCVFCFAVGVLHVMLKRGFAFSVYNMNILLEGLCKNLEYDKTVTLLLEVKFEFSAAGCWDIMPPHCYYGMKAEAKSQEYRIKPAYFVSHNLLHQLE